MSKFKSKTDEKNTSSTIGAPTGIDSSAVIGKWSEQ